MGKYYNMSHGKYMYIHGKCLNKFDEVLPQPSWLNLGIGARGREVLIRSKIQHITLDVETVTD